MVPHGDAEDPRQRDLVHQGRQRGEEQPDVGSEPRSGNGVSSALDYRRVIFVNPELTVHLHRPAEGEWVCLQAETIVARRGVGLAVSTLHDLRGPIGYGLQSLLLGQRKSG